MNKNFLLQQHAQLLQVWDVSQDFQYSIKKFMKKEKMSVIVIYQKHNTVKIVYNQLSELRVNYKANTQYIPLKC
jgi:hypothetical protein